MSTMDDRLVLAEYEAWRLDRIGRVQALGVEAFLAEREHGFNVNRIANALTVLNGQIPQHEWANTLDNVDARNLLVYMIQIRDILQGDRPFTEDSTLTGTTTRTYL